MKRTFPKYLGVAAAAMLCGFAAAVQAQTTVFSENFEGIPSGTDELAPWSDTADLADANYSLTVQAGAGKTGTQGLLWQANFRPATWSGWLQANMGYGGNPPAGNTDPNLSDYILSFDMRIISGATLGHLQLNIQGWSDPGYGGTMTQTGGQNIDTSSLSVGGAYQHLSVNLGDLAGGSGFNPTSGTYQFQWQVNGWELGGGGSLGEKIAIDNVLIMMVPEPSSLALIGLGAAALLSLRNRRNG